jgi:hypothetical protein
MVLLFRCGEDGELHQSAKSKRLVLLGILACVWLVCERGMEVEPIFNAGEVAWEFQYGANE